MGRKIEMNEQILEFEEALLQINRVKAQEIFGKLNKNENNFGKLELLVIKTLELIGRAWPPVLG